MTITIAGQETKVDQSIVKDVIKRCNHALDYMATVPDFKSRRNAAGKAYEIKGALNDILTHRHFELIRNSIDRLIDDARIGVVPVYDLNYDLHMIHHDLQMTIKYNLELID